MRDRKNRQLWETLTRWISLCSISFIWLSRTKKKWKEFYSHYITHHTVKTTHTKLTKFHTMHYSLSLLFTLLISLLSCNYNNKPLQPIMHNTIGYPSKYNLAIKVQLYPLKLTKNMPTNKTILTTSGFHLSLAKFYLCSTHTLFLASLLVAMLQQLIFLHVHWSLNSAIH